MDVYIVQSGTTEKAKALRAFMEALEIDFEVSKPNGEENPYDPKFVAKILKGEKDIEEGKGVTYTMDELRKSFARVLKN